VRTLISIHSESLVPHEHLCDNSNRMECSLTQATDTNNIRLVFTAVKETLLQNALKDSGVL
jgi:hypothetical protein